MSVAILGVDHLQLAMPPGGEAAARAFYQGLLGMREIAKPDVLYRRGGGLWFTAGRVELHLGVEAGHRPSEKAHPAFAVSDLAAMIARCEAAGVPTAPDAPFDGRERVHVRDPFGNRIELIDGARSWTAETVAGDTDRP